MRNDILAGNLEEIHIVDTDSTRLDALVTESYSSDLKTTIAICSDSTFSYSNSPKLLKTTPKPFVKQYSSGWNNQGEMNPLAPLVVFHLPFGTNSLQSSFCAKDLESHSLSVAIVQGGKK